MFTSYPYFILICPTVSIFLSSSLTNPISALMFSVHPCNHMTSIWLTGRRYSLLNILCLSSLLYPIFILPLVFFGVYVIISLKSHANRQAVCDTQPPVNPNTIYKTAITTLQKLSGIYTPSFLAPAYNLIPYFPYTQPCAERYLSLPLILLCTLLSHTKLTYVLLPLYTYSTLQLIPMYKNIDMFYKYHYIMFSYFPRLGLFSNLYMKSPKKTIVPTHLSGFVARPQF